MSNKNRHYFAFSLKIFNRIHDGYFLSEITDKKPFLSIVVFCLLCFVALRSRVYAHRRTRTSLHARFNKYASNMPRKHLSFALAVSLASRRRIFVAIIRKFYNLTFFKTLDSDMQYKYNAISVEATIRN